MSKCIQGVIIIVMFPVVASIPVDEPPWAAMSGRRLERKSTSMVVEM
jgi:hypothetical protein